VVLLGILALGIYLSARHERTQETLERMHEDLQGGLHTLHTRADREGAERGWSIQGIRNAIELLRLQVLSLFREKDR